LFVRPLEEDILMMGHAVVNSKPATPITAADTATTLK
jgi:hypothetical protein